MILLLLATALAADRSFESQTVVQLRHDLAGQAMAPAWELLRAYEQHGSTTVQGYLGLEWASGLPLPVDPDVYLLSVDGSSAGIGWTLGRQQALTFQRSQTFDGARLRWRQGPLALDAWGGWARHQDLDDLSDGSGIARVQAGLALGPGLVRLGLQAEAGPGAPSLLRQDLQGHWALPGLPGAPTLDAVAAVAEPDFTVERLAVRLDAAPVSRARLSAGFSHRRTADPDGLLGEAILGAFAPDGVEEGSAGLRLLGASWASLELRYALGFHDEDGAAAWGHSLRVDMVPGRGASVLTVLPSYRFEASAGGEYHAALAVARAELDDSTALAVNAGVVPYRKLHEPWATALDLGCGLDRSFGRRVSIQAGAELTRDAVYAVDLRADAVLTVELP